MSHSVVPIFDAYNHDISRSITSFGAGSKARIAYKLLPFYYTKVNYGVSAKLIAVQVVKYVPFIPSRNGEKYGFSPIDGGYNAELADASLENYFSNEGEEDIPF